MARRLACFVTAYEARPRAGRGAARMEPDHRARSQRPAPARSGGVASRTAASRAPHAAEAGSPTLEITGDLDTLCDVLALRRDPNRRVLPVRRAGGRGRRGGLRAPRLHRESAMPQMKTAKTAAPGPLTLVATGCGTAIACVCALGLGELERRLGGLWSVLAIAAAALLCGALARALGRLSTVVPSGAGLMAFLSRGLGRRFGLVLMLPYVVLGDGAGRRSKHASSAPSAARLLRRSPGGVGALAFLVWTWAVARSGLRLGLRAQAVATGVLMIAVLTRSRSPRRRSSARRTGPISSSTSCPRRRRRWRSTRRASVRRCSCSWASSS